LLSTVTQIYGLELMTSLAKKYVFLTAQILQMFLNTFTLIIKYRNRSNVTITCGDVIFVILMGWSRKNRKLGQIHSPINFKSWRFNCKEIKLQYK